MARPGGGGGGRTRGKVRPRAARAGRNVGARVARLRAQGARLRQRARAQRR